MEAIESDEVVPTNHSERVEAIGNLIRGEVTGEAKPGAGKGTDGGDGVQAQDARGDGSGPGAVAGQEHNDNASVHDDTEDAQKTDTQGAQASEAESGVTIKGLAEHLDIEPSELYELEIPIADGQTMSLGELKDEYKKYGDIGTRETTLKEADDKYHRQVLATRSELNSILSVIPDNIRTQVIQAGQQAQAQWTKDQEAEVLESIPDWQDTDKRAADRESIVSMGSEYGFSEPEMTYTQDARTLLMLRDFAQARKDIADMKAAAKRQPGKPSQHGKGRATTQTKRKLAASLSRAKESRNMGDKVGVVSQLIRGN